MRPYILCLCLVLCATARAADAPAPSITSASPNTIDAGGPYFLMTINGTGFLSGAVVSWSGSPLGSTFVSSTQIKAAITVDLRATSGTFNLTVTNPDGMVSNAYAITVSPVIATVTPAAVLAGSPPLTITITGIGFTRREVITFDNLTITPAYVDSATLTAAIPASALAATRTASIRILDPLYGNTSAALPFDIRVGPVIASASPNPVDAGGSYFPLTVTGTGFVPGSTVNWAGAPVAVTLVSSTQLQAAITPDLRSLSGTFKITVGDSTGAVSHPYAVVISPVLFTVTPALAVAAGPSVTITAAGVGFTRNNVLVFNAAGQQSQLTTTYVNSTTLTAMVPASALRAAGAASVQVVDPAGSGRSLTQPFTISSPAAAVLSLVPNTITIGAAAFTIAVNGTNFPNGATVLWNGAPLTTTFVTATQLAASAPAGLVQALGAANISVASPGGIFSNSLTFTVNPPPATVAALFPASATAGAASFTLTVTGANFASGTIVQWNTTPLTTTFVSPTQVQAFVPSNLIAAAGSAAIKLVNPSGTISNLALFTIDPPALVLSSLSPSAVTAGAAAFLVTVNGANLAPGATVFWNGSPLATRFVSATQLTASAPAALVQSAGAAAIVVSNPGGAVSNSLTFTISPPPPTIAALFPASAAAGAGSFTLTVTGLDFSINCVLRWNGSPLATTFVSSTQVTAAVPPAMVAATGAAVVTLINPSGLGSNAVTFLTVAAPPPAVSSIVNGASGLPSIAPGSLISIYGANLAAGDTLASTMPLPTSLNATSVTINGIPAPLNLVSASQINAQAPSETKVGTATLLVQVGTLTSAPVTFEVIETAPGVLTNLRTDHALALNLPDGLVNSPDNPALPGQSVAVYLTGQGPVDHPVANGAPSPASPLSVPLATVQARVGGKDADIALAGLAPGLVGLLQLILVIPDVDPGEQPCDLTIGGVPANRTVLSVGQLPDLPSAAGAH